MPEIHLDTSWEWAPAPWGTALRCRPLATLAAHLFTTREPALAGGSPGPDGGWAGVAAALGVDPRALVTLEQVHGRSVFVADGQTAAPSGSSRPWGKADAVVSIDPRLALSVRVADCVPALLADRRSGAVAAVHAGWRGTVAGVADAAVRAMAGAFGTDPTDIVAAIGPCIGPCCYRVGAEVADAFAAAERWHEFLGRWLAPSPLRRARLGVPGRDPAAAGGRALYLDTWTANADQLAAAGVPRSQIHISELCTSCHRDVFHSYRVDGEKAGRMAAMIRAKTKGEPRRGQVAASVPDFD